MVILHLSDRVYRIHEVQLAMLEAKALSYSDRATYDLFSGKIETPTTWSLSLGRRLQRYTTFFKDSFKDELGIRSADILQMLDNYGPHLIYTFKGRMVPSTASALISILSKDHSSDEGLTVLDPFMGSGTVIVEAMLKHGPGGFVSTVLGNELVPYYHDIARAKVNAVRGEYPELLTEEEIENYKPDWNDPTITDIIWAWGYTMHQKGKFKNWVKTVYRRLRTIKELMDIFHDTREEFGITANPTVNLMVGSATHLSVASDSVDMIVTSPPYSLALRYQSENPIPPDYPYHHDDQWQVDRSSLDAYRNLMLLAYDEMYRVLKWHGRAAIVIGNQRYKKQFIDNVSWTKSLMLRLGFTLEMEIEEAVVYARKIWNDYILIFNKNGVRDDSIDDEISQIRDIMGS